MSLLWLLFIYLFIYYYYTGAETLSKKLGTRVIKLALFDPAYNYPWNSQWDVPFNSIVDIARHRYFDQVLHPVGSA